MILKEAYISEKENAVKPDATKTVITNEAFALVEAIVELTNSIDSLRRNL